MMAIVNGAEVIPMRKPKSAPIVLEPARLDNVSQFLARSATSIRHRTFQTCQAFSIDGSSRRRKQRHDD